MDPLNEIQDFVPLLAPDSIGRRTNRADSPVPYWEGKLRQKRAELMRRTTRIDPESLENNLGEIRALSSEGMRDFNSR